MVRAGAAMVEAAGRLPGGPWAGRPVLVLCGRGNNGGDGFVVARLLHERDASVTAVLAGTAAELRGEAAHHFALAGRAGVPIVQLDRPWADFPGRPQVEQALAAATLVVDALLGTGVSGPVTGLVADLVALANAAQARGTPVLAVDLPSGVESDTGRVAEAGVQADLTVTMIAPKLGLALPPGAWLAGRVLLAPLGVPAALVAAAPAVATLLQPENVRSWLPFRRLDANKGDFGAVLTVAGSVGMTGAAYLTAQAALRTGAGIVRLAIPASLNDILEAKTTEVITVPLPETPGRTLSRQALGPARELAARSTVVVMGPGLSRDPQTQDFVRDFIPELALPLVLDADGLNALAGDTDLLAGRPAPTVITPHPGEMGRLLGLTAAQVQEDRVGICRRVAEQYGCVVVLKGARTLVAEPGGELLVNPTGNPGMASGGTGDVLSGMIGGLISQGLDAFRAAGAAVYLHGLAGDLAAARLTGYCLIAGDLLRYLPDAFRAVLEGTAPAAYPVVGAEG
jgi:NAD(P)H-hydrate epimerase